MDAWSELRGRLREFFDEESTALAVTVGVVLGLALHSVFQGLANGIVLPNAFPAFEDDRLSFSIGGFDVQLASFVAQAVAFGLLAAVAALLLWPPPAVDDAEDARECPECLSVVLAEARRCAFCTSALPPVTA